MGGAASGSLSLEGFQFNPTHLTHLTPPDAVQEAYGVWAGDEYVEASSGAQKKFWGLPATITGKWPAGEAVFPLEVFRFNRRTRRLDAGP